MLLSVVVPVHNEAPNIPQLIRELAEALGNRPGTELIVVDDGSTDNTLDSLRRARNEAFPAMRIFRHEVRCGQSTALLTGATAAGGVWLATLDGDGQNDPADLPALLAAATAQVDGRIGLVIGHRVDRHDSWLRRASSRIANRVRGVLLGDGTPDTGCGLKVIDRRLFLCLPYFDHMHRFLPALVKREGFRVASVPVSHRPRTAGHSHYGVGNRLWVGIADMLGVVWLQRRYQRLVIPQEQ